MTVTSCVQSIDRLFEIIEALSCHSNGMFLADLTSQVGLPKSTVHRLLSVACAHGYVAQDAITKRYRLTLKLYEISSRIVGNMDVLSLSKPYLDELSEFSNEVVHLVIREGREVVYVYKADSSSNMIRMASHVGLRNPMYCTGVGKAILAYLSEEEVREIWNATDIRSYTEHTIVDFAQFNMELSRIRTLGYAVDNEEHEAGVCCISGAIFNNAGLPIAAMSISSASAGMNEDRVQKLSKKLTEACRNISALLGRPMDDQGNQR